MEVRMDRSLAFWNCLESIWVSSSDDWGFRRVPWKKDLRKARRMLLFDEICVSEYLSREKKQAGSIMLREIHPGYILPVGVWNVRESIRAMLLGKYSSFDTFEQALDFACSHFLIGKEFWISSSELLKQAKEQRKISQYFRSSPSSIIH